MTMATLLKGKRLVICDGPGGVGKTTSSAAVELACREELTMSRLRHSFPADPILTVPHLPGDVHDVDGLWDLHEHLFAPGLGRGPRRL
jgi:anion-transporting  ArsA/GET3 family ATPase